MGQNVYLLLVTFRETNALSLWEQGLYLIEFQEGNDVPMYRTGLVVVGEDFLVRQTRFDI